MRLLAAEPRSIAGLLFPCQYFCGTILVSPCSMVWDWRVSRVGLMPFYWPSCSLTFCLLLFSLSLLSFCGLVLWGWGLRTDGVLIALSSLALPTFLIIIIIIIIIKTGRQCNAEREWYTPYQSEDLSPTTPTYRQKEEKRKKNRRL